MGTVFAAPLIPEIHSVVIWTRPFTEVPPAQWIMLPNAVRQAPTLYALCLMLKTFIFTGFHRWVGLFAGRVCCRLIIFVANCYGIFFTVLNINDLSLTEIASLLRWCPSRSF